MYLVASPPQIGERLTMYFHQLHYLQREQRWLFFLLDDITLPLDFFILIYIYQMDLIIKQDISLLVFFFLQNLLQTIRNSPKPES